MLGGEPSNDEIGCEVVLWREINSMRQTGGDVFCTVGLDNDDGGTVVG